MLNKDIKSITYQEKQAFKLAKLIKYISQRMNEVFMNKQQAKWGIICSFNINAIITTEWLL